jgi:3-oxoadipate CoA-transferase alpha subunit
MINKIAASVAEALAGVKDGSTVMIGGFGTAGTPLELIDGLIEQGARDLTVVNNNAGNGDTGQAAMLATGRVRKIICSFPRQADSHVFDGLYRSDKLELELVPQGNLSVRLPLFPILHKPTHYAATRSCCWAANQGFLKAIGLM